MMLGALAPLLGVVKDGLGKWLSNRRARQDRKAEVKLAKLDVEKAGLENRARLLRDKAKANTIWEQLQIQNADRVSKRYSLIFMTVPIGASMLLSMFGYQDRARAIWEGLALVPLWYTGATTAILLAAWGIRQRALRKQYEREVPPAERAAEAK